MNKNQSRWNILGRMSVFMAYVSLIINNFLPILYIAPNIIRAQEVEIVPTLEPTPTVIAATPTLEVGLTAVPTVVLTPTASIVPTESLPLATPTSSIIALPTDLPTEAPTMAAEQKMQAPANISLSAANTSQTVNNVSCLADRPGQTNLQCTANDISIAAVSNVIVNGHGCRYPGDVVNFTASWDVESTATSRYNVGLWFATAGQTSALNGSCSVTSLPSSPEPFFDNGGGDSCGDIHSGSTGSIQITMDAVCNPDESGFLKLPYCTTWQQNEGKNTPACNSPEDTLPGSSSKCSCNDGISVPIEVPASLEVKKVLSPATDTGLFNLQIGTTTYATDVGNGGSTGKHMVNEGTNTVGELAGTNSDLNNYDSNVECKDSKGNVVSTSGNGPWTLNVTKSQDVTCVITNTRKITAGVLVLEKVVHNNYGGTAKIEDFQASIGNTGVNWGVGTSLEAGSYTVSETNLPGYVASSWSGDCQENGSVVVEAGKIKTCTITNSDLPGKLIVKKVVINDNGGTAVPADFQFSVNGGVGISFDTNGQNALTVNAGSYNIVELPAIGYGTTYDNCTNILVKNGETKTCTVTNDDIAPSLTLQKIVTNQNGGISTASDFTLTATGSNLSFGGTGPIVGPSQVEAGIVYTLSESGPAGYQPSEWTCTAGQIGSNTILLQLGQKVTCSIVNTDLPGKLIIKKNVINDNGGTAVPADFQFSVNTGGWNYFNQDGVNELSVSAGTYSVLENEVDGYSTTYDGCENLFVGNGETKTCVITNDDKAASITLVKQLNISYGGMAGVNDFGLSIGATSVVSGQKVQVLANQNYTLNESGLFGYEFVSISGEGCPTSLGGNVNLKSGVDIVCTIMNRDLPATLIVEKKVVSAYGSQKTCSDFGFSLDNTSIPFDSDCRVEKSLTAGTYTVVEDPVSGFETSYDNCGEISLKNGEVKTCTITNSDLPGKLIVKKVVINDNGGTAVPADFQFSVNGGTATSFGIGGTNEISVNAGNYTVNEIYAPGYSVNYDGCDNVFVGNGEVKTCTITNNDIFGKVNVVKFNDRNGNGRRDENEEVLPNWMINLSGETVSTDLDGLAKYEKLMPGDYYLGEIMQPGWRQTVISCDSDVLPTSIPSPTPNPTIVPTIEPTPTSSDEKMNICHYNSSTEKWNAQTINLSAWNTHSGHGDFTYAGNLDKNGHPVTDNTPENRNNPELNGDAWCMVNEPNSIISKLPTLFTIKPAIAQEGGHLISVKDSKTVNCEIGNMRVVPNLTIAKSNNKWPVVQAIGNKVKFSLKLTVSGSNVKDVRVFDLPAFGFKYDLGSYAVLKNGVNMPIAEPIYASPGKWLLGDLNVGDVIEMTYLATIQNSVDPGLYKDVAYAFGCQDSNLCTVSSSDRILASSVDAGTIDPGVLSPTFVGTKILLTNNSVQSNPVSIVEEKKTEIVKTLPKTGANEMWMLVALAFGFAGLIIAKRKN